MARSSYKINKWRNGQTDRRNYITYLNSGGRVRSPKNLIAPSISGTPQDGQTLTTNPGQWSHAGSNISYSYQWQADGVNIPGATDDTYLLTTGEVGAMITVIVTASSGAHSDSASSAAVGPVIA